MSYRQQSTTIALDSKIIARFFQKSWRMNQVAHHQKNVSDFLSILHDVVFRAFFVIELFMIIEREKLVI
ncbi:hypothetical protein KM914_15295 [Virgibacillus pantothenticus]|uniref:Uncharacterized protein n=2 Tax=Virgibacillus pantothenticus TaxID=1473 RepID=A0A0L0QUT5_VIRPA|nr:hypothetical protein [Virgibacillus pantothenticus]KNE22331.1 hypothetical protein AFK71_01500 [Virgibacillus pantothenticus]MBU8567769.1 hypothetical protein [Virgibacillus pantothenticus]MBU8643497.1 hypothetical protein [Virgibacillus pantothenticus]MBU8647633.1 hypothetical protein [Virgibacillus pantothenticus]MBU8669793.1 hypothetical protein [Virgibacillus pantothenticus]